LDDEDDDEDEDDEDDEDDDDQTVPWLKADGRWLTALRSIARS